MSNDYNDICYESLKSYPISFTTEESSGNVKFWISIYNNSFQLKFVYSLGLDVQDLDDIEILASKESELYKCEGTCVKCQSGCETNS